MNVGDKVVHKFTYHLGVVTSVTPDHAALKVDWDEPATVRSNGLREFVSANEFRLVNIGRLSEWAYGANT